MASNARTNVKSDSLETYHRRCLDSLFVMSPKRVFIYFQKIVTEAFLKLKILNLSHLKHVCTVFPHSYPFFYVLSVLLIYVVKGKQKVVRI